MILRHQLEASDRPLIEALLGSLDAFTDAERAVALELCDLRLAHPDSDDYRFILGFLGAPERLAGYLCYGKTPMTERAYDLYWLGTSPDFARLGVARGLVASMEEQIAGEGGGLVRVETGTREEHGAAVRFYEKAGFTRAATIADYYEQDDDLVIFMRSIAGQAASSAPTWRTP